jgi:membrane protein YdbS with pleckstrin-like domain
MKEELAFPYTISRSGKAQAMPLGASEVFRFDAVIEYLPWRGLALTLFFLSTWYAVAWRSGWRGLEWAWIAALALGLIACIAESAFRRDRLLPEGLERRSGLLGRRIRLVPYESIQSVTVQEPGKGSRFDVGTVVLRVDGGEHRLVAVCAPNEVADIIETERKAVRTARRSAD